MLSLIPMKRHTGLKTVVNVETLRVLAARIGAERLLEEMKADGISHFTATEMFKGTYLKEPRGCTREALSRLAQRHNLKAEEMLKRIRIVQVAS